MKLKRREKVLASLAGGVVVLVAGYYLLFAGDPRSTAQLLLDRDGKQTEVQKKEKALEDARRDEKLFAEWRRRSLPSDPGVARSTYQTWLRDKARGARIRIDSLDSKDLATKKDIFARFEFTLVGKATLTDLTTFLFGFYSAPHLHQIRSMLIEPGASPSELKVNMKIEALALVKADRKEQLSNAKAPTLMLAKVADYSDVIVKRNIFSPPTPDIRVAKVDAAEFAFVTAFVEVDGQRQVWIQDRMAGKTSKLSEGEQFQIGDASGTVQTIDPTGEVTVEYDGHRRRLHFGENLRQGVEVREPKEVKKQVKEVAGPKVAKEESKEASGPKEAKAPNDMKGPPTETNRPKEVKEAKEVQGAKEAKG